MLRAIVVTAVLVLSVAGTSSPVGAQPAARERKDAGSTVDQMSARIYQQLFDGIALTAPEQEAARRLVADEQRAQRAVKGRSLSDTWNQRIALNRGRDSSVRVLLRDPQRVTRFDRNAARFALKPLTPEQLRDAEKRRRVTM